MTLEYRPEDDLSELRRKVDHLEQLVQKLYDLTHSIGHVTDANVGTLAVIHRELLTAIRRAR